MFFFLVFFLLDQKERKTQDKTICCAQGQTTPRFAGLTRYSELDFSVVWIFDALNVLGEYLVVGKNVDKGEET